MRLSSARSLAFGCLAGVTLSVARVPAGMDLLHVPASDWRTAATVRCLGLLLPGLVLVMVGAWGRVRVVPQALLGGVLLGFALDALLLEALWRPVSMAGFVGALGLLSAAMLGVGWTGGSTVDESEGDPAPAVLENAGLLLGGAGMGLAFEALARRVRLLGLARMEDDSIAAVALVACSFLGAIAIGAPLIGKPRARRLTLAAGPAIAALLATFALGIVAQLGERAQLDGYLRRFGMDLASHGTAPATFLLAAAAFILPAFAAGTVLFAAAQPVRMANVLLGAACGVWTLPRMLRERTPLPWDELQSTPGMTRLTAFGATAAAIGGLLILLSTPRRPVLGFAVTCLCLIAAPVSGWLMQGPVIALLTPWTPFEVEARVLIDAPEGMLTVESAPGGKAVATLDRRRLTPLLDEEVADEQRMRLAWASLPPELRSSGKARLLLVGQITPRRAEVLRSLGVSSFDRTAPWHESGAVLDAALFEGFADVPGTLLSIEEARERLDDGAYDLVIVPPVRGPLMVALSPRSLPTAPTQAPALTERSLPSGAGAVVWVDATGRLGGADLGEHVLLSSRHFDDLCVGVLRGFEGLTEDDWTARELGPLDGGAPGCRTPWITEMLLPPRDVARRHRARILERLAKASEGTPRGALAEAMALHYAAQAESSPWETRFESIELEEEALTLFRDAGAAARLDLYTRAVLEELAEILVEKRMPNLVLELCEPLAVAHSPWPFMQYATARAYMEFDMPEEVVVLLEELLAAQPENVELAIETASWLGRLGRHDREAQILRQILARAPERHDVERLLGMALVRAGDPEGMTFIEEALLRDPDDETLLPFLGEGPYPTVEQGYRPPGGMEPEDEHHP